MNTNRIQDSSVSGLEGCVIITNGRLRYSFSLPMLRLREFHCCEIKSKNIKKREQAKQSIYLLRHQKIQDVILRGVAPL